MMALWKRCIKAWGLHACITSFIGRDWLVLLLQLLQHCYDSVVVVVVDSAANNVNGILPFVSLKDSSMVCT